MSTQMSFFASVQSFAKPLAKAAAAKEDPTTVARTRFTAAADEAVKEIGAGAPEITIARAMQDVPAEAINVQVVDAESLPQDRTFRAAWKVEGKACVECPTRSKAIPHQLRRKKREAEFKPFDDVIAKRLPGEADAEAGRAAIRAKYAQMQDQIDACENTQALRAALGK